MVGSSSERHQRTEASENALAKTDNAFLRRSFSWSIKTILDVSRMSALTSSDNALGMARWPSLFEALGASVYHQKLTRQVQDLAGKTVA